MRTRARRRADSHRRSGHHRITQQRGLSAISACVACAVTVAGCGGSATGPHALKATSTDYFVRGQYAFIALDRVESLKITDGRLVLHGPPADLVLDLPS